LVFEGLWLAVPLVGGNVGSVACWRLCEPLEKYPVNSSVSSLTLRRLGFDVLICPIKNELEKGKIYQVNRVADSARSVKGDTL